MKAVVAAFNQEKALVGASSVIVQLHRLIVCSTILEEEDEDDPLVVPVVHHILAWRGWSHTGVGLGQARSVRRPLPVLVTHHAPPIQQGDICNLAKIFVNMHENICKLLLRPAGHAEGGVYPAVEVQCAARHSVRDTADRVADKLPA